MVGAPRRLGGGQHLRAHRGVCGVLSSLCLFQLQLHHLDAQVTHLLLRAGVLRFPPQLGKVVRLCRVELSRDRKSCHRSRHVDRRYFKIRELCFEGQLRVEHIDTKLNSSDLLTKPLPLPVFLQHRRRLFNLSAASSKAAG